MLIPKANDPVPLLFGCLLLETHLTVNDIIYFLNLTIVNLEAINKVISFISIKCHLR